MSLTAIINAPPQIRLQPNGFLPCQKASAFVHLSRAMYKTSCAAPTAVDFVSDQRGGRGFVGEI